MLLLLLMTLLVVSSEEGLVPVSDSIILTSDDGSRRELERSSGILDITMVTIEGALEPMNAMEVEVITSSVVKDVEVDEIAFVSSELLWTWTVEELDSILIGSTDPAATLFCGDTSTVDVLTMVLVRVMRATELAILDVGSSCCDLNWALTICAIVGVAGRLISNCGNKKESSVNMCGCGCRSCSCVQDWAYANGLLQTATRTAKTLMVNIILTKRR